VEREPESFKNTAYITSQVLHGISGFCCGDQRLFEASEFDRSRLIQSVRDLQAADIHCPSTLTRGQELSIVEQWNRWVDTEQQRRLTWCVYQYDCLVFQLHSNKPYSKGSDLTSLESPCPVIFWDAETAQAWKAIQPWKGFPGGYHIRESTFHGLTNWGESSRSFTREPAALIHLLQSLCSALELAQPPPWSDISLWHNDSDCYNLGAKKILGRIDAFYTIPMSTTLESSLLSRRQLMCEIRSAHVVHISHLHSAGGVVDLVQKILRLDLDPSQAYGQVLKWGLHKGVQTREAAFHAAQVLGLVRCYPLYSPSEVFNLFNAGMALFFLVKLLARQQSERRRVSLDDDPLDPGYILRLDYIPADVRSRTLWSRNLNEWMHDKNPFTPGIFGLSDLRSQRGPQYVLTLTGRILESNSVWGISRRFRAVIEKTLLRIDAGGELALASERGPSKHENWNDHILLR
jgi:hypothetical protein